MSQNDPREAFEIFWKKYFCWSYTELMTAKTSVVARVASNY